MIHTSVPCRKGNTKLWYHHILLVEVYVVMAFRILFHLDIDLYRANNNSSIFNYWMTTAFAILLTKNKTIERHCSIYKTVSLPSRIWKMQRISNNHRTVWKIYNKLDCSSEQTEEKVTKTNTYFHNHIIVWNFLA